MRTSLAAFVLCAVIILATARFELDFEDCGSPAVTLLSVVVEQDSWEAGGTVAFNITGLTKQDVTGGTFSVLVSRKVFFRQIPFYREKGTVCEFMGQPEGCSFKKESLISVEYTRDIPRFAPKGVYYVIVRVEDQDKETLACITLEYHLNRTILFLPA